MKNFWIFSLLLPHNQYNYFAHIFSHPKHIRPFFPLARSAHGKNLQNYFHTVFFERKFFFQYQKNYDPLLPDALYAHGQLTSLSLWNGKTHRRPARIACSNTTATTIFFSLQSEREVARCRRVVILLDHKTNDKRAPNFFFFRSTKSTKWIAFLCCVRFCCAFFGFSLQTTDIRPCTSWTKTGNLSQVSDVPNFFATGTEKFQIPKNGVLTVSFET